MEQRRALIHIGKHKTGTTSFQFYISDHEEELSDRGVLVVPLEICHFLAAATIREGLPIPPVKKFTQSGDVPSLAEAQARLQDFLNGKRFATLLLSSEHFSYFRTQAEIDALNALLTDTAQIAPSDSSIYLVLRRPEQWLASYRAQCIHAGHETSQDKTSPYYCEPDSWIADDASIVALWESNFPSLKVIDYDAGNSVVQLSDAMDLPRFDGIEGYRKKVTRNRERRSMKRWARRNLPTSLLKVLGAEKGR